VAEKLTLLSVMEVKEKLEALVLATAAHKAGSLTKSEFQNVKQSLGFSGHTTAIRKKQKKQARQPRSQFTRSAATSPPPASSSSDVSDLSRKRKQLTLFQMDS
jgi:hypothetical protein